MALESFVAKGRRGIAPGEAPTEDHERLAGVSRGHRPHSASAGPSAHRVPGQPASPRYSPPSIRSTRGVRMAIDTVTESARKDSRESFEVTNPADGSVIRSVPLDGPAEVGATVARVRANQPAWEALGFKGRARWLVQAARLDSRPSGRDRRHHAAGNRQGPRRSGGRVRLPDGPHQLLRQEGREVHRGGARLRALPVDEGEEAASAVPALPRRGRDQPVELPADPLPRATRFRL